MSLILWPGKGHADSHDPSSQDDPAGSPECSSCEDGQVCWNDTCLPPAELVARAGRGLRIASIAPLFVGSIVFGIGLGYMVYSEQHDSDEYSGFSALGGGILMGLGGAAMLTGLILLSAGFAKRHRFKKKYIGSSEVALGIGVQHVPGGAIVGIGGTF